MRRCLLAVLAAPRRRRRPPPPRRYDYDALGAEFCRLSVAGESPGLRPLFTAELNRAIDAAAAEPRDSCRRRCSSRPTPTSCRSAAPTTRNAALVEIDRSKPGGAPPSWTEYLVIVPEADGSSRIDDVLFATRRSDTLRARLAYFAAAR